MANLPSSHYMTLVGGANALNSDIYTSNRIVAGDTIRISGTNSNNGIFLVTEVVNSLNTASGIGTSFTDNTCDTTSGNTTIQHDANSQIIAGLSVSGSGIPAGSHIASITNSTSFVLSKTPTGSATNVTLTFADMDIYYVLKGTPLVNESTTGSFTPAINVARAPGDKLIALGNPDDTAGVAVWSNNATTSYSTKDNGWTASAINPTLTGDNARYIYHFVDEALRTCNTNNSNKHRTKWFGFIQRKQFQLSSALSFAEWQEHPNNLNPPKMAGAFSYSFGGANHTIATAANYYQNNRGVAIQKKADVSSSLTGLRLQGAHNATTNSFIFETTADELANDQATVGEVISIDTALGSSPTEFLFCKKESDGTGSAVTYQRDYGRLNSALSYSNHDGNILERGVGWNLAVTSGTDFGTWASETYEFYQTFIYDGAQESLPVPIGDGGSTIARYTLDFTAQIDKSMRVSVYADLAYNARVSGGRIYTRKAETNDDLILLADIDIVKGVRTTLDGDHKPWVYEDGKGYAVIGDAAGNAISPNLDTYTSINGFSPDVDFISIGGINEGYQSSVVANRRTFIANVRLKGQSGDVVKYGDRIMYSEINKFDTFLNFNYIDVSSGDYGEYTALESYADRLLAFKNNLVHVINITSPSVSNWYLEDTIKYYGVEYPYSVTKTKYGIAWVSDNGCYLYDGQSTKNLTERKMAVSEASYQESNVSWSTWFRGSAVQKDVQIGYDATNNSLIMFRSPKNASDNSNQAWIYDFDNRSWVFNDNLFTDSSLYTNFISDWNNNLTIGLDNGSDVEFYKYIPVLTSQDNQEFVTKDIDFGSPGLVKKVYAIYVTYKSNGAQTTPFKFSVDGKQNFSGDGGGTFTGNFANTSNKWDVVTLIPSSVISCQSLQIKFEHPSSGIYEINDMSIEYRILRTKKVS